MILVYCENMPENKKFMQNKSLAALNVLIGKWKVTMNHSALPNALEWEDSFEWFDNSFIIWHWQGKNEVPQATSIISRNENSTEGEYSMFYYDERGVSRIFDVTFEKNTLKYWREDSDFFQRIELTVSEDGNTITGHGENSHDKGKSWKHDFDITYTRIN